MIEAAFREAMQDVFGLLDWLPVADGTIRRFQVPGDKPGTLNGWYVLFADGIASGAFGSWKAGGSWHAWSSRKPADPLEAELVRQRIEQMRQQREAEQHQRQQAAAERAARLCRTSAPAKPEHPYLLSKGTKPHGLRQLGPLLLVPMCHAGELVNLQRIYPDGGKRFLPGGRVTGCYSPIGTVEPGRPLYVCEGWATGATLHEETGAAVACAMNAGNLLPVGQHLQRRYPELELVIAADDDRQTEGNPGRTAATHAASVLGCGLVLPAWPDAAPQTLSDFNDLRRWREGRP